MPRKGRVPKRDVLPDAVYGSKVITKLINNVMLDGKKGIAQDIVYGALEAASEKTGKPALDCFNEALNNVMPVVEVKARRVGEVRPERRQTLGLRWLVEYTRKRKERTMQERLTAEILDAMNNTGGAVRKRDEVHKMAEANKAFAHFRY